MKNSNPDEVVNVFEEQEVTPIKSKKKKQKTKKSDHKHVYEKYVLVERKLSYFVPNKHESVSFHTYKKCNICGKLEFFKLPEYIYDDLEKTFDKNPLGLKHVHIGIGFEEAKYLEKKYPDLIEISYLEL